VTGVSGSDHDGSSDGAGVVPDWRLENGSSKETEIMLIQLCSITRIAVGCLLLIISLGRSLRSCNLRYSLHLFSWRQCSRFLVEASSLDPLVLDGGLLWIPNGTVVIQGHCKSFLDDENYSGGNS
jgi:hypothetical protein